MGRASDSTVREQYLAEEGPDVAIRIGFSGKPRTVLDLDHAKRLLAERLLRQLIRYLGRDPRRKIMRLMTLGEKLAPMRDHREQIREARHVVARNPVMMTYVERLLAETDPRVQQRLLFNWFFNAMLFGIPKQRRLSATLGVNVPNFILLDPTSACNLRCTGCWAGEYPKHDTLDLSLVDRVVSEAKELGIYWIVMSGGEPFAWPHLFALAEKHQDVAFMLYTNGTLIDDRKADRLLQVGNVSPAFSLEGWEERTDRRRGKGVFKVVMAAMDRLRERRIPFGFSVTITRENVEEVTSDEFMDFLVEKGCRYGWMFHYIPVGRDINPDLLVTPEQRAYLARRVPYLRTHKPLLFADFWNDGELTVGCIAGGRRYFHITAAGDVEPCAFAHFTMDNIKDKSLLEVLGSPLFRAYQQRQPFSENLLRPCPIIDVPEALRRIVTESGARPTYPGADSIFQSDLAAFLDQRAADWQKQSDPIWHERCQARCPGEKATAS